MCDSDSRDGNGLNMEELQVGLYHAQWAKIKYKLMQILIEAFTVCLRG